MSDEKRWTIRAYHQTPENAAAMEQPIPPSPTSVARGALSATIEEGGCSMDLSTLREDDREAVVIDGSPTGYHPAGEGEEPTGHIVTWSAVGREPHATDENTPVIEAVPGAVAVIPVLERQHGGDVRIEHNLGGPVTVTAKDDKGRDANYLFASPLDENTMHVELLPGTALLLVTLDA